MAILGYLILTIYVIALILITLYCLLQFHLLYHYKRSHRLHQDEQPAKQERTDADWPLVTVKLPIYNEQYVIERLINSIAALDYPKDKLQIHILDDSTDETVPIVDKAVAHYQSQGFDMQAIRREKRSGFKAGALKDAMPLAKGAFIAIFDADFVPLPGFLKATIPHFDNPKVGVVQTRWEHLNRDYSLITQLQAIQLNVHFRVEQQGRRGGQYLLQFNGTAGVWRSTTIEDAGGWEADTLTEDLDLSIRAQLKGWEITYLESFGSPAELPAEMNGLKSQQFRWMKGGAETARKMLPAIWRSNLRLGQKLHATGHLLSSSVFVFVFSAGVFSVPLVFLLGPLGINTKIFATFLAGLLATIAVYYVANVEAESTKQTRLRTLVKFVVLFPLFLALSMGLSFHNSVAVIQGYLGKKTAFVRTPKFNIQTIRDSLKNKQYISGKLTFTTVLEGLLALYFLGGVIGGITAHNSSFLIFHAMLALGYGAIFIFTLRHLGLK